MNIKGKSRAGGNELAKHLLNAEKNETVKVIVFKDTVAQDLPGAFQEMEAIASGTRCTKPLYHAKISPDPKEPALTPEQWQRSIDALRDELGLTDHAYVAVLHKKYGAAHPEILREHMHVVFGRINPDTMLAMHDGHNYRKHELVSRQLEKEFGHARIQGAHIDRGDTERPPRTPPDWMMQQAAKSGIQPGDVAGTVKQLWNQADSAKSFAASLGWEGLTLAMGRRDLVVLDQAGDVHTLARCLDTKVADIRDRMASIDRDKLPTVEQARAEIRERNATKAPASLPANDNQPNVGTLPGGMALPPDAKRAALWALVSELQQDDKPQSRHRSGDDDALREKLAGFGFDASKEDSLGKWRELDSKVEGGRITEKDRLRDMAQYLWDDADRERRQEKSAALKPIEQSIIPNRPGPDRDR